MNSNTSFNKQIEEFLSLQDFWILCRSHSSWFGLSLAMFLLVAIYYLSITPDVYTCEASVLVKEETTQGTVAQSSNGNNFNNMALIFLLLRQVSVAIEISCYLTAFWSPEQNRSGHISGLLWNLFFYYRK